ncbi:MULTISPECIES: LapA family protein [Rhodococcus]|uniref:LapA family protein n=1 Tax=Rhodococcus rhodochrous TaxID=1829 RepID=A0AAW4XCE0_RHORH|nr:MULTISPECIES: LapA family protein [Rhodococcus]MCD2110692.1 LapA family protein [Rhodococcus rhodochrous]WAL45178.1 LapA family protein [Rhodococcus pyridinivorans]
MAKQTRSAAPRRSFRVTPRRVLAVVLVLLAALFVLQNRNSTSIDLFWISLQAPLWLVLVVIFAVGWVAGFLFARGR